MTIGISVAALTLSLATFVTGRWRDLVLRLQDRLVTAISNVAATSSTARLTGMPRSSTERRVFRDHQRPWRP
jgi:hypothetical protein